MGDHRVVGSDEILAYVENLDRYYTRIFPWI
jgi:hypothetical protein